MSAVSYYGSKFTSRPSFVGMMFGVWLIGLGVGMCVSADIGVAPYDLTVLVLSERLGLSFGQTAWIVSGSMLGVGVLLGARPDVKDFVYVGLFGFVADFAIGVFETPSDVVSVGFMFVSGFVLLIAGVALVGHSGLAGGYEMFIRGVSRWVDSPVLVRGLMDVGFFVAPVMLGGFGSVGAGTVIFVLLTPPLLKFMFVQLGDLDYGKAVKEKPLVSDRVDVLV